MRIHRAKRAAASMAMTPAQFQQQHQNTPHGKLLKNKNVVATIRDFIRSNLEYENANRTSVTDEISERNRPAERMSPPPAPARGRRLLMRPRCGSHPG